MNELVQKDKQMIWHPFTPLGKDELRIPIVKGEGVYLITEDGRRIIDGISSWWVNIHGHGNKVIADAIAHQAITLEHVIFTNFIHEPAISIAENVLSIVPGNQQRVFFSDDGSTSVEVALKLSLQFWYNRGIKKKKVIAIDGAYHGDTFGAMSVGGRSTFSAPFNDYLFQVAYIPFPDGTNDEEVLDTFRTLVGDGDVASFIFEPLLQGAGGMRTYSASILDQLIGIAHSSEIVCIADEVLTGFGRTGKLFASENLEHKPDIFCMSKGLTGGTLALGLTSCNQRIADVFLNDDPNQAFYHGHSYTANPIACAAANASFGILMDESCGSNRLRIEAAHRQFELWLSNQSIVKNIRVLGTLLAFEIHNEDDTSYFNEIRHKVFPFFIERNILLRPLGNVLYILPPYVITNSELEKIYEAIKQFLHHLNLTSEK